jgi:hypothetical protein
MITAIDTNILLDILIPDEAHMTSSKKVLDEYLSRGQLIICELVYAELSSQFSDEQELLDFFSETGIKLVSSSKEVLYLAGTAWKEYARNRKIAFQCPVCGKAIHITCPECKSAVTFRQHIISDFIIGAHALVYAKLLLSRDRGFYMTYFKDLKLAG